MVWCPWATLVSNCASPEKYLDVHKSYFHCFALSFAKYSLAQWATFLEMLAAQSNFEAVLGVWAGDFRIPACSNSRAFLVYVGLCNWKVAFDFGAKRYQIWRLDSHLGFSHSDIAASFNMHIPCSCHATKLHLVSKVLMVHTVQHNIEK